LTGLGGASQEKSAARNFFGPVLAADFTDEAFAVIREICG